MAAVRTADSGKSFAQIAAFEVIVDDITDHLSRIAVLADAMLIVIQLEIETMTVEQLP